MRLAVADRRHHAASTAVPRGWIILFAAAASWTLLALAILGAHQLFGFLLS